jgi:hydroxymethylglutaryl-CoA reductase (NADPH)
MTYSVDVITRFPVEWRSFMALQLVYFKNYMRPNLQHQNEASQGEGEQIAAIPMQVVGPVRIISAEVDEEVPLPLATLETPLWPSTHRGARVCTHAGGIRATIIDERMTRSVLVEADSVAEVHEVYLAIQQRKEELQALVSETSRFARLININGHIVGSLLFLRFELLTGDASGHNMVTLASDRMLAWVLSQYPALRYVSISGNLCTDKKVSAVNGLLGRGKNVVAEVTISRALCKRFLKTTPEKVVDLNIKKNLLGSIMAGSLRSANAHFANMLLGFYLATGQDAANIIEGSQGIVHAELRGDDLYFSVTLPNIIIGTVGSGKTLDFVRDNLRLVGCYDQREPGYNARRLAIIAASAVLCGELSLLAVQTDQGELMRSHLKLERNSK